MRFSRSRADSCQTIANTLPRHCTGAWRWLPEASVRLDLPLKQVLQYATNLESADALGGSVRLTDIDSSPEVLRRLVEIVAEHNLAELEVEQDGVQIRIKGMSEQPQVASVPVVSHAVTAPVVHAAPAPAPVAAARTNLIAIESPMVGTFYRSPTPEDPPFIKPGDVVTVGQTVGLIEAMKVYSEVPAEVGGRVVELAAENGKLVQMGQAIAYVEPL